MLLKLKVFFLNSKLSVTPKNFVNVMSSKSGKKYKYTFIKIFLCFCAMLRKICESCC